MGSRALPALHLRPMESSVDAYSSVLRNDATEQLMRAREQDMQTQQMVQQSERMKLQQMQQAQQEQQTIMSSLAQNGGDFDKTLADVRGRVSLPTYTGAVKWVEEHRKNVSARVKQDGENYTAGVKAIGQASQAILNAPPEQRAAVWGPTREGLIRSGLAKPEELPVQYPGDQFVQLHAWTAMDVQKQLQEQRDQENHVAELPGKQADSMAKQVKQYAPVLANSRDQADYDAKRNRLPFEIARRFPDQYERSSVLNAGMEPNQIVTAAQTDRHNRVQEGLTRRGQDITVRGQNMVDARARESNSVQSGTVAGLPPEQQALVDQIGTGKMEIGRLGYLLARNPALMAAVSQKYPDFDSSKIASYKDAYRDFTSGASSKQVQAGAVAIQHLHQLKQINDQNPTESRIPGTAAYKAFHNLLDTVAGELVTFYGEPKTNEAFAHKKSTLGGLTNRDAAILEQAQAMGVKMDELEQKWHNAAPSGAYQAPIPGISNSAKRSRAALDPNYAGRVAQPAQPQPRPQSGAAQQNDGGGSWFSKFGGVKH